MDFRYGGANGFGRWSPLRSCRCRPPPPPFPARCVGVSRSRVARVRGWRAVARRPARSSPAPAFFSLFCVFFAFFPLCSRPFFVLMAVRPPPFPRCSVRFPFAPPARAPRGLLRGLSLSGPPVPAVSPAVSRLVGLRVGRPCSGPVCSGSCGRSCGFPLVAWPAGVRPLSPGLVGRFPVCRRCFVASPSSCPCVFSGPSVPFSARCSGCGFVASAWFPVGWRALWCVCPRCARFAVLPRAALPA